MKIIVVLGLIGCAVSYKISEDNVQKFRAECAHASEASPQHLQDLRAGTFHDDDEKLKDYVLCFSRKVGSVNEDGQVNVEGLKETLSGSEEEVSQLLAKCVVKKDTPKETSYEIFKCLYRNSSTNRPRTD